MILSTLITRTILKNSSCVRCRAAMLQRRCFSEELENKYSEEQKMKILEVVNNSNTEALSGYDITQNRLKKVTQWKNSNGAINTISDLKLIEGFSEMTAKKLFNSILDGPTEQVLKESAKIRGKILHPHLSDSTGQKCKSVLSIYIAVNSVCWTLVNKSDYEVTEWRYHGIDYPEEKKMHITDIMDIAWKVIQKLPTADVYVMKGEATTLRAAGSDPNNPKVLAVNLQQAQLVAMIVALINVRSYNDCNDQETSGADGGFNQKVYFLRPTLPYRLYGTLVGKEKVSTEQAVEMILQDNEVPTKGLRMQMPERLKSMFRAQKDLQKDMLGHCLLLALTFMDVCIYKKYQ